MISVSAVATRHELIMSLVAGLNLIIKVRRPAAQQGGITGKFQKSGTGFSLIKVLHCLHAANDTGFSLGKRFNHRFFQLTLHTKKLAPLLKRAFAKNLIQTNNQG